MPTPHPGRFIMSWRRLLDRVRHAARQANGSWLVYVLASMVVLGVLLIGFGRSPPFPAPEPAEISTSPAQPIMPLPPAPPLDPRKLALGQMLFEDPRLSGNGNLSCASCHDMHSNGALAGPRITRLDTPTLFNAALNFRYGWEGHDRTLEGQAIATILAPIIARGVSLETMIDRLRADPRMRETFERAYGHGPDEASVGDALATYERSLITPGSRFDRWLQGDAAALGAKELQGYALFRRLGCASCHQGRNIGGNLFERQGIFRPLASPKPRILRVPSLRNVAETAPYFHDGSAATLETAVWRMANAQLNRDLSVEEVQQIAAFLRTLTGTYHGQPVKAPKSDSGIVAAGGPPYRPYVPDPRE